MKLGQVGGDTCREGVMFQVLESGNAFLYFFNSVKCFIYTIFETLSPKVLFVDSAAPF